MNPKASSTPSSLPLPPVLEGKLADFRRRVWYVKLAEGLLAAVFGLALSYVLVFALDRFMETPGWLRLTLLAVGSIGLGITLPLKWHRWVWQQRQLEDAARLLRRNFPRLGDQLLGIVELARHGGESGRSESLVRAAMNQAAESVKDADFTDAVPEDRHRSWAWAAGGVAALALLGFFVVPAAAWNALARWVTPWKDVERYTFAKVEKLPEHLVVPYAEPFDLDAKLRQDTEWKPESGRVRIEGQAQVDVPQKDAAYNFTLPPQKQQAEMKVSIGDVRKSIDLAPTPRPEMKNLQAELTLPDYLQYKTKPMLEARGGSLTLLDEAKASFILTASRALRSADFNGKAATVEGDRLTTAPALVKESSTHVFAWQDVDGLSAKKPLKLKVHAVKDQQPNVLARRENQEQVFLDTDIITFDIDASDDFGVKQVGIEWRPVVADSSAKASAPGQKIASAGAPETKALTARATFSAKKENVAPQTLEVRAWAEDYKPGQPRAVSPAFVIHIMAKDDHVIWMTDQFGKWLQAGRETYEQEQRLHEANKELRELTEKELDRPENRRRIAQQANAEEANQERLNALNSAGKKLIEQAARNDAFDAERLETWANMLRQLKDIANTKMPTVADLLKKSANAQASAGQQGPEGQKGQPSPRQAAAQSPQQQSQPSQPGQQSPPSQPAQPGQQSPGSQPKDPQTAQAPTPPSPGKSAPEAPKVTHGESTPGDSKPAAPSDPKAEPPTPTPSVADNEKSFLKPGEKPADAPKPGEPAKPSAGALALPNTMLGAAPEKPSDKPQPDAPADSPARQELDKALDAQKDLLASFAKVSDKLRDLLASLEASTFVKRLKSASKKQMAIASSLSTSTLSAFGLEKSSVSEPEAKAEAEVAERQQAESSTVRVIQSDLEAYYQRKQDLRFKNILDQMKKVEVVAALQRVGEEAKKNLSGRSIIASEYWADTLDRWAEELVGAAEAGDGKPSDSKSESLPPEIVLKVMQVLHDEMKLRDETREAEASKPALDKKEYFKRGTGLALKQDELGRRVFEVAQEIAKLPNSKAFGKEMKLLGAVTSVMKDAYEILDKPDTGPTAIAAETEAIELLLETRRQSKGGGGGGGGSNPGGGGGAASASSAALADIGPGADMEANLEERQIGQSTGKAGKEAPEEFKAGLDAYFNALERTE